ncbi:tubulin polyglutamylase complex subunit 2 [Clupea harengus]|uniref:Tubulin polyglutamylase complex subunit 2 n=1 Tax=Clupea harengus TaxID=7950 RepID=A0A6P3VZM2_CLUHA|nr:tubulin polyglutamylase complex subunit 2 [Clupea harengus]XP_042565284.1 tubulin polyglutamylase complex subunit 2 [Clupea harengus]
MEESKDEKAHKVFIERLTLGVTRVLESLPGVIDVRFAEREPAEKRCLLSWEQKNACALPEDLRDFYLTTDGFTLTWSSKLENECVSVGCMVINSVVKLRRLGQSSVFSLPSTPTIADLDSDGETEDAETGREQPHFDSRSRIFELDPCAGNGKVCLVYKNCTEDEVTQQCDVWFLDRSLYWHYLTPSFTAYYRLMITHLGLPEWQYNFTPYGPSPQAKQWAALYQPLTFHSEPHLDSAGEPLLNKLDPAKAFRGRAKQPPPKKKPPAQASSTGSGGTSRGHGVSGRLSVLKR